MSIVQCPKCHSKNAVNRVRCRECGEALRKPAASPQPDEANANAQSNAPLSSAQLRAAASAPEALSTRYRDAYLTARAINGLGEIIKGVSIFLGIVIVIMSTKAASGFGVGGESFIIGLVFGTVVGFLGYVGGVLLSAQGQILKATLDSAVNTSPLLSNENRLSIMSLR